MDVVLAGIKGNAKKKLFKLLSDEPLFDDVSITANSGVEYSPDHNLDDDAWFSIAEFSQKPYCLEFIKGNFDSKDYDELLKDKFTKITYVCSLQSGNFYFQKITPSLFVSKKMIAFGDVAKIKITDNDLIINHRPDAVYFKSTDTLVFRNLATISSIFKGIDSLYKEATQQEVTQFLDNAFIELAGDYNAHTVSKPNRKRVALAMETLSKMSEPDRKGIISYIGDYSQDSLTYDKEACKFEITTDDELKFLLYGIEQRFYTTPVGSEKRLANSVQAID